MPFYKQILLLALGLAVWVRGVAPAGAMPSSLRARVVVLHSYHHGFTWTDNISRGIQEALAGHQGEIELCFEFMDTRRLHSADYFDELQALYRMKYRGRRVDALVASDDHALNFVLGRGRELFPGVPVVFCSVSGYSPDMRASREMTGLQESIDIRSTLDVALRLHPETRRVAVITDMTRTGRALKKKAEKVFRDYRSRLDFGYLEDLTVDGLQEQVASLSAGTIVFLFIFTRDADGRVLTHEQNLRILSRHATVPIYAVWEFYLGYGIVGGKLTSGVDEGRMVGKLVLRILEGERASAIPIQTSPTRYMFDHRQLSRFGVDDDRLPEGSVVINRPFSFYQAYKPLIWGVASVFAVLLGLVVFLVINITRRRRAEEERRRLEMQIQHVQKLESLGVLAGGIAHDFNNLLMGIMGSADLALFDLEQDSPLRVMMKNIVQTSKRAAELCRQMLAYSGKGKFVIQAVDLSRAVREIRHMLEVSVSKKAELKFQLAGDLPAIRADATQIGQVIINLVTNASEALENRPGVITVATGVVDCDREYLEGSYVVEDLAEGRYVYLEVEDSGTGMDEDTRARLFDPFFTTKFTGRGLGLSVVLGIVRGHRGAVKVYSEKGRGSCFRVLLPVQQAEEPECPAVNNQASGAWTGSGTVLLVDDEEAVRRVGRAMLEKLGFQVLLAKDGSEAVRLLGEKADRIDCVVLDLTMPGLDGEECFREMRRIKPDVRVVLSSGFNQQELVQRYCNTGIAGFIQKPYLLDTLRSTLEEVLRG